MNETTTEKELPWLEISLRVMLGGIFIWAGCAKLIDLSSFVESISHFEISPFNIEPWDMWLGYSLPVFEVIVGSILILGFRALYRGALVSTAFMSAGFLAAIYSVHTRGLNIECGCLGNALSFGNYYIHMAVLTVMTLAAMSLIWIEIRDKRDK